MPDHRTHRGPHPEDLRLFAPECQPALCAATADLSWLLDRGYPRESSLKLVGDRYGLLARQRLAVGRSACSAAEAARRAAHQIGPQSLAGRPLWLDGYNVLTTIEAALAGGIILAARDGTYRDMASMHGSYRKVAETVPALELLGQVIAGCNVAECLWFLDRPVSNSGRLRRIMEELAAARAWPWRVELVNDPDAVLADPSAWAAAGQLPSRAVAATADSIILDRCPAWFNLARETIDAHVPEARVVRLAKVTAPGRIAETLLTDKD
jgi:hypothetical protein